MTLRDSLTTRLPSDGPMGALKRKRPSLYYLILGMGAVAFTALLAAGAYGVLLLPLVGGRALIAAATGTAFSAAQWLVLLIVIVGLNIGLAIIAARWVGEFTGDAD